MQPSLNSDAVNICQTDKVEPFPIAVACSCCDVDSCRRLLNYVAGGIRAGECFLVAESLRVASDESNPLGLIDNYREHRGMNQERRNKSCRLRGLVSEVLSSNSSTNVVQFLPVIHRPLNLW